MKKLLTPLLLGLLTLPILTACEGKVEGPTINQVGPDMGTDTYTVRVQDWQWNTVHSRYQYVFFDAPWLDEDMYWDGLVTAAVHITEEDLDDAGWYDTKVLRNLPFVHTYNEGAGPYTETIGFDIGEPAAGGRGSIMFYIQASDLDGTGDFLTDYSFKVTWFRDTEY